MYKTLTIFFLSFFMGFFSNAQNPQLNFVKDLRNTDHYYSSTAGDQFGNTIVAGRGSGHLPFIPILSHDRIHYVFKLDTLGIYQWVRIIGTSMPDGKVIVTVDEEGNSYVSGRFLDSLDLDGGPGVHMVYAENGGQYILKLDPNGDFLWGGVISKPPGQNVYGDAYGYDIAVDQNQNVILTGRYNGTVDFDPGLDSAIFSTDTSHFHSVFLLKLDSSGSFEWLNPFPSVYTYFDIQT